MTSGDDAQCNLLYGHFVRMRKNYAALIFKGQSSWMPVGLLYTACSTHVMSRLPFCVLLGKCCETFLNIWGPWGTFHQSAIHHPQATGSVYRPLASQEEGYSKNGLLHRLAYQMDSFSDH